MNVDKIHDSEAVVSSVCGSVVPDATFNDVGEDDNGEEVVDSTLKQLGNVSKKRISGIIMKDDLGAYGEDALHGIKKVFEN